MNKNDIIMVLEKLNFSKLEADIYLTLLESEPMSGYQLAKKIDISRSSIYNAIDHMYEKGMVLLVPNKTPMYRAQKPEILFEKLQYEFDENTKLVKEGLQDFLDTSYEENFLNLKGFENIIFNVKEMLKSAKREVYINTDFDLEYFRDEFAELKKNGVRVIVFSFIKFDDENIDAEIYSHNRPDDKVPNRIMCVVDNKSTLIADTYKARGTWIGTITNNKLMVSIMAEHIHHDIYLLKLQERADKDIFDEEIKINTDFEKGTL